jgi:acetoin utilization protein AcuB
MLVRDRMTTKVLTVAPETGYDQTMRLLRENKVRRLPVVDARGRVVGIVSEKDLMNAAPSAATSLDRHEITSLLAQLRVRDVMTRGAILVQESVPIEEAARLMADNKIGGLPVVDEQQNLVGIITETDIFRTMLEMLGARRRGLRVTFRVEDQRGTLAQLAGEVSRQGGSIIAIGLFGGSDQTHPIVLLKVDNADEERLVATLRGRGAEIIDVRKV